LTRDGFGRECFQRTDEPGPRVVDEEVEARDERFFFGEPCLHRLRLGEIERVPGNALWPGGILAVRVAGRAVDFPAVGDEQTAERRAQACAGAGDECDRSGGICLVGRSDEAQLGRSG